MSGVLPVDTRVDVNGPHGVVEAGTVDGFKVRYRRDHSAPPELFYRVRVGAEVRWVPAYEVRVAVTPPEPPPGLPTDGLTHHLSVTEEGHVVEYTRPGSPPIRFSSPPRVVPE